MHEPFASQLAIFVASRPLLALYREFVFPSVSSRTGLLPAGIDDIKTRVEANMPLATDIALSRAAVVVYDSGGRSRLQLDYVQALRNGEKVIVVAAPAAETKGSTDEPQRDRPPTTLERPSEMGGWPQSFVVPLLNQLAALSTLPTQGQIAEEFKRLSSADGRTDLILVALALLEREMRKPQFEQQASDEHSSSKSATSPADDTMTRLQEHFGTDSAAVIEAMSFRHDLLQNLTHPKTELERVADSVVNVAHRRLGLPSPPSSPRRTNRP